MKNANDPLHEACVHSEQVFGGRLLQVHRDRVRLPDGAEAVREWIAHPGAVVIIPVLPDGRLIFERQFRYPVGRSFLELPAGKIDAGEELLACAQRELLEETGHVAAQWRHLGVMHPCIGYSDEHIEIFLAEGLEHRGAQLDEGEFLELVLMSLEEAEEAVLQGALTDSKTITALFWARRMLRAA